jgi:hypothetical protein
MRVGIDAAWRVVAVATALAVVIVAARKLDPIPEGVRAQYFSNADSSSSPELSAVDRQPSTDALYADWSGRVPESFTVVWTGALWVPRDGAWSFATISDQESWVEVDGRRVVENPTAGRAPLVGGPVQLQHGAHAIVVRYVHHGGVPDVTLLWKRNAASLEPIPSWAMRSREISDARFLVDWALDRAEAVSLVVWLATIVGAAALALRSPLRMFISRVAGREAFPLLAVVVAASAILNIVGIRWGLPGGLWAGDEITPNDVLDAWSHQWAHGWWAVYPPLHYIVLGVAYLPVRVLGWIGLLDMRTPSGHAALALCGRAVSLAMSAATLVATFICGRRLFGWRAGLFASAMLALATPFVYYAKTANVEAPYLFWLVLTLVFYLRVLAGGSTGDYTGWAAAATFAICTKDQAYAFCAGMPIVVVYETWRANRGRTPSAFLRALTDRRLAAAALTAVVLFAVCQNLAFDATGFAQRLTWLASGTVAAYRQFEPTVAGRLGLMALTARLLELSLGWPFFVLSVCGLVLALSSASRQRAALWLLVPVLSYYFAFINVVLYNYDRFVLPICLVLVVFGGLAFDRLTAPAASWRYWRLAGAVAIVAYTALYAATVDVLMLRDSRYTVEQWLAERTRRSDVVGERGLPRYLPRLARFRLLDLDSVDTLNGAQPRFVALNADYTRVERQDAGLKSLLGALRGEQSTYRLALRVRSPSPWPALPGGHPDLVGDREDPRVVSFLRNINPTIEVYERR